MDNCIFDPLSWVILALTSITIFGVLAYLTAEFVYYFHWAMGSPSMAQHNPKRASYKTGRLFSAYGAWVALRYGMFEQKEDNRIMEMVLSSLDGKGNTDGDEMQKLFTQYNLKHRKLNPYKALGVCIMCFAPHLSNIVLTAILLTTHFSIVALPVWAWLGSYLFWWALILGFINLKEF